MELLGSPNASEKLTEQRQEEKKSNHSYSNIQKNALTRLQMVLQVVEWTEWKRERIIPQKQNEPKMMELPNVFFPSIFLGLPVSVTALAEIMLPK